MSARSRARYRRWVLPGAAAMAVAVCVAGVVASRWVRSPQQALADLGPPAAVPLLEPVGEMVIRDTVVTRGEIAVQREIPLDIAALVPSGNAVVTRLPLKVGDTVSAGSVVVEVSGRPVLLLGGDLPTYRDLIPGLQGPDVVQLQAALTAIGYRVPADGTYGPATSAAVSRLYADRGYSPVMQGDPLALADAQRAVMQSERQAGEAQESLAAARAALSSVAATDVDARSQATADRDAAERAAADAQDALAAARERSAALAAVTGASVPRAEAIFLPSEAAVVVREVGVELGDLVGADSGAEAGDPADVAARRILLTSGDPLVRGVIEASRRDLVRVGMAVQIREDSRGWTGTGVIAAVSDELSSDVDQAGYVFDVTMETAVPSDLVGRSVRLSIEAAASDGPVLAVPLSAIVPTGDGSAVDRVRGAERMRVPVALGVSGQGYIEVEPRPDGALRAGDEVVIGVRVADPASTPPPSP